MRQMVNVAIVDDHPVVREGIKNVITHGGKGVTISSQGSTAEELFVELEKKEPDLLILDIGLPNKSGLDVLKELKQEFEDLPVLILSMHPEERFAIRALKAGASGYLNKKSITKKLMTAIEKIVNGEKYISNAVAEQLAKEINGEEDLPHKRLSDREYQVMCMIASGKKVKEIAEELDLSSRTIHTYRSRLMEKMDLGSNVAITRYALSHKLIEEP